MLVRPSTSALTPADLLPADLVAQLETIDVVSRRVFSGKLQGERRSKRRGRSVEFDDFRPYVAGDDLRHIDWNVFARLDKFFIKLFQEEEDLSVHVVLDTSASMRGGEPEKLRCAARIAAALSAVALANNNRLYLSAVGDALRRLEPMRGRTNLPRAVRFLLDACAEPERVDRGARVNPSEALTDGVRAIASSRSGRGVMVVLSDLLLPDSGYEAGLRLLAGETGGYQTYVFQVLAPGEIDPSKEEVPGRGRAVIGDMRLMDAESGRSVEVTITPEVLRRYRSRVESFVEGVRTFCVARGMVHALVPSDTEVGPFVLDRLRRMGVVG